MIAAHKEAGILRAQCRVAMAARAVTAQEADLTTMSTAPADMARRAVTTDKVVGAATVKEAATATATTAVA